VWIFITLDNSTDDQLTMRSWIGSLRRSAGNQEFRAIRSVVVGMPPHSRQPFGGSQHERVSSGHRERAEGVRGTGRFPEQTHKNVYVPGEPFSFLYGERLQHGLQSESARKTVLLGGSRDSRRQCGIAFPKM